MEGEDGSDGEGSERDAHSSDWTGSEEAQPVKPPKPDSITPPPIVNEGQRDSGSGEQIPYGDQKISQKDFVDRIRKSDRWMILLTGALVLVGIGQILEAFFQWKELESSGVDTSNLVVATQNLAMANIRQVGETREIRTATQQFSAAMGTQANNTHDLVVQAQQSASAAQASANTARDQLAEMRIEKRPWVSLVSTPEITTDLHIEPADGPHNATIGIGLIFTLKNTGSSPAIDTDVHLAFVDVFAVIPDAKHPKIPPAIALGKLRALCKPLRSIRAHSGITVFPGTPRTLRKFKYMEPGDLEIEVKASPHSLALMPTIVGCIDYRFPEAPTKHHQTTFIYQVMEKNPKSAEGYQVTFSYPGQHIAAASLQLNEGDIVADKGVGWTD